MSNKRGPITPQGEKNFGNGLRCWEDVNQQLARLGEIERHLEELRSRLSRKVAELKQLTLQCSSELEAEREELRRRIERFYWQHHGEVLASGRKSLELPFGRLGARRSTSLVVENPAAAQEWLLAHGFRRYLRTRVELDREALRSALLCGNHSAPEEAAALLGCPAIYLRESEQFWYEVNRVAGDRKGLASLRHATPRPALSTGRVA